MNQILSVEIANGKSKKSSIYAIVVVFAVFLMIFGIGIAATGAYSYYENSVKKTDDNLVIIKNTKPQITIERQSASKINILVTHDKELKYVRYTINDSDQIEIPTNNQTKAEKVIELDSGTFVVSITSEDIKGVSSSYTQTFEVKAEDEHTNDDEEKPKITLDQVEGKIQATVESKINIDTVTYYWDGNIDEAINYTINDVKNETLIDVLQGVHTLTIKAKDIEGRETEIERKIIGDSKPILTVVTDGKEFIINASDDEELSKIEITLNSEETITEEINSKEYNKNIELVNGENKLIVTVYNKNGISAVSKVKFNKE